MSFADRVKETTKSQGTGTIDLNGAEPGHQSFVTGFGAGTNRRYGIVSSDNSWEIGEGTVTSGSPNTLSRDTVYSSSNNGNKINLTGTSTVFSTAPATLILDSSGDTMTGSLKIADGAFLVFDKASGNGMKVDVITPTFGFADLLGDQFNRNTGPTKPTLANYNGAIDAWQFSDGDEAFMSYHIPHDYVIGTDLFLHIHWSQTSATATGGTVDFKYSAIYAKGHNQAAGSAFTATPITAAFSSVDINDGDAGLSRYQHHLTEVVISAEIATAALFDRDNFEPDGVIELTLEMDTNSLTNSVAVLDPFIHFIDIHYQTTGVIGTKSRTPDFYT